jgi:murein DD-endopeptidase MepM/ murein hydrolase activator NlpD
MTKNGNPFTFLFKRSNRSRIFIRRVEISTRKIQNGALLFSAFLFFSLFAGGLYGVVSGGFISNIDLASASANPAAAQVAVNPVQRQTIDYSRPDESDEFSFNAGGPVDPDELDAEGPELEKLMRSIQASTNPAYLPSIWPHASKINNEYGFRRNPFGGRTYEFHAGMDIDGERGDIVVAPGGGIVREAGYKGGYGNMIEIDHGNGLSTRYGHLSKIDVGVGDTITRGSMIGLVGSTGRSTGPHLHYELRVNDRPVNPRFFLPAEPTELTKR